jgi:very-short-patch-repair endonuclease
MIDDEFSTMKDAINDLEAWEQKIDDGRLSFQSFCDRYSYRISEADRSPYNLCESPAETKLLHFLQKGYTDDQILPQVRLCGYRIDFVTSDGVAWEVDGKKFHEKERDEKRDMKLMESGKLRSIIRVPAGAVHYFFESIKAVFYEFTQHNGGFNVRHSAMSPEEAQSNVRLIIDAESFSHDKTDFLRLNDSECFEVVDTGTAYIGGALAFCYGWQNYFHEHELNLMQHKFTITKRI